MSWLSRILRPQINTDRSAGSDTVPGDLWQRCSRCEQTRYYRELKENLNVCVNCQFHMPWPVSDRLAHLFDDGTYQRLEVAKKPDDPLRFRDSKRYVDRLRTNRNKTGENDAGLALTGRVGGRPLVVFALDFAFMGGSVGTAVGDVFVAAVRHAVTKRLPMLAVTASGGARMQEGLLSLMQLPRTIAALEQLRTARLLYLVLLTHPTTGGVSASFAMLGDIHLAEPGATIGFAGRRVIEQTVRENLPSGFQTAEYLRDHGMIDLVVPRRQIPATVAKLLKLFARSD